MPAFGINWRSNSNRLPAAIVPNMVMPVALPPGRLRLATRPDATGSPLAMNTMGMVWVAALTTCGAGSPPVAFFQRYAEMNANARLNGDIGEGDLVYRGTQGTDNPQVSVWEISICGGARMTAADGRDATSKFGVMTGPQALKDKAAARRFCF
jgi:hypothetical protein